jgi:hypothetical protein
MAWPTTVTTTNLDSDTDSPYLARPEIYATAVAVNDIIASRAAASLDATTKVPTAQLPIAMTTQTFQPSTTRVTFENIIRLTPQTVSELTSLTGSAGDIAYCSNGDAGSACVAVYNGTNWKKVVFGANISAT